MVRHRRGLSTTCDDLNKVEDRQDRIEREFRRYSEEMLTTYTARDNNWFNRYREADTRLSRFEAITEAQEERIKKLERALGKRTKGLLAPSISSDRS